MAEWLLGQMVIVEPDVAGKCGLEMLTTGEAVGVEDIGDAAVEALHHAVGLGCSRLSEPVLDAQGLAEPIELMAAGGQPGAAAEEPIGELGAVVGENLDDTPPRQNIRLAFQMSAEEACVTL